MSHAMAHALAHALAYAMIAHIMGGFRLMF